MGDAGVLRNARLPVAPARWVITFTQPRGASPESNRRNANHQAHALLFLVALTGPWAIVAVKLPTGDLRGG